MFYICVCVCVSVCVRVSHVSVDGLAGVLGGLSEGVHVGEHLAGRALEAELVEVGVGQDVLLGREALPAQSGNLNTWFFCFCLGERKSMERDLSFRKIIEKNVS